MVRKGSSVQSRLEALYFHTGPLVKRLRHRPFTAVTRVRIPYGSPLYVGGLAQLGEHLPYKQGVGGSSPSSSTIYAGVAQLVEQLSYASIIGDLEGTRTLDLQRDRLAF